MPLPQIGGTWPPQDQQPIYQKMNEWQAWWAGDTTGLANAYAGQSRPSFAARGGVVGAVKRMWHGQPQTARPGARPSPRAPRRGHLPGVR